MKPKSKYTVRLLSIAEQDFTEIIEYILIENYSAARSIVSKIENGLMLLQSNPNLGRTPNDEELHKLGYRYLIILDYLIFYKIEARFVYVYRIIHGARNYKPLH